jgi:ankyrin repeat protein
LTGATPLHCASHHGHASIVKLLLQVGADVNRAMSDGRTPMWFASSYCHADVVRVINDWAAGLD